MIAFSDSSRRGFLQTSALATGALFAGGLAAGLPMAAGASLRATQPAPGKKLRILILGGTGFIGPWMAEFAVARGHHVTLFNRGQREKYLGTTDGTKTLYGNRDPNLYSQTKVVEGKEVDDDTSPKGLSELAGKKWDAVIDNSGFVPRIVKASAELLAPNVGQYLFISTLSVYADNSKPGLDESDTLSTIDDPTNEAVGKNYGALKALCEQAAETAMPGRVTNIRPGYIVGPRDATDRLTYWPVRASRGGEVLVPGNPADAVQFIDVRDLADFTIRCVENKILARSTRPAQSANSRFRSSSRRVLPLPKRPGTRAMPHSRTFPTTGLRPTTARRVRCRSCCRARAITRASMVAVSPKRSPRG